MNDENNRIKIAFLTMSRDPNDRRTWRGWSGSVYHIAQALRKHYGEISYFTPVLPCRKYEVLAKIIELGSQWLLKKKYCGDLFLATMSARTAAPWLDSQSFDVIIAPDGATDIAFLKTDIPILLIGDSTYGQLFDYYPQFTNLLKRSTQEMDTIQYLALKKASIALYSSSWAARSAIERYGADPEKVHVAPFGANLDASPSREVALARKKSDRCCLLFLGVEWARKGGDIAFETLLGLEEMGVQAELIVCGCTPPNSVAHEHMKVIPFLDKNDERQREELEKLLMRADFLLVPTRAEAYGLVFCEAGAFGLPVIATDTGGVSEIIRDGENGFLLTPDARGAAYAEVIARVYRDEKRYAELVWNSRTIFEDRLNWDAWGRSVKQILTDLLAHT